MNLVVETQHKTNRGVKISGEQIISTPRELTPVRLKIAKAETDEMEQLGAVWPAKITFAQSFAYCFHE